MNELSKDDALLLAQNKALNQLIASFMPRSPSYRYYIKKDSKDRFFWTTEPLTIRKGDAVRKRWASGIYKYKKGKKMWVLRSKCLHATRKGAKLRADKLLEKSKKPIETPTPKPI